MNKTATSEAPTASTRPSQPQGFTIVELLVVMGVILILAGIILGVQRGVYHSQATARARADMAVMASGLEQFKALYGDYPWINSAKAGNALYNVFIGDSYIYREGTGSPKFGNDGERRRPLLDIGALKLDESNSNDIKIIDPWGSEYMYFYRTGYSDSSWENPSFLLMSKGPDGTWVSDASVTKRGVIPDDFFTKQSGKKSVNLDTIIYGYEN